MNTWVFLLLATSSTTSVQSDQGSAASSPVVIRKEYSGPQDQVTGESSPRKIFLYPPSGGSNGETRSGHHEDSKYHRPGVLHSRYLASSHEEESSKSSQLNTLPLQTQRRNQENNKNDSHKDSRYHGSSSASSSINNNQPSHIPDQMTSGSASRAEYGHAPHDRFHEETREAQRDSLNYHNSQSSPSDHISFSHPSRDQSFEDSSPHVTYVLPPHGHGAGNHDKSIDEKREDFKYPNSKDISSLDHGKFSTNHHDQLFDESGPSPSYDHPSHSGSHEDSQDEQHRYSNHRNPTGNPSVPNRNGLPLYPSEHPYDKSTSKANYETHNDDMKYHSEVQQDSFKYHSTRSNPSDHNSFSQHSSDRVLEESLSPMRNPPVVFHSGNSPNLQDHLSDGSASRVNFDHPSYDGDYKKIRDEQNEDFKYHSPTSDSSVALQNSILPNQREPSPELRSSLAKLHHHSHEEIYERNNKNNPSDSKFLNPKNNPSVVFQSGYSTNTHVQSSDQTDQQSSLFNVPSQKSQSEITDQADFKHNERPSLSSVDHHNGSPSETNDQSSDESFHRTVYIHPPKSKNYWKNHNVRQGDSTYVSSRRIPSTAIHDVHPSNIQVNPVHSNNHFNPRPRQSYGEKSKTVHDFEYQSPTISPPKASHNSYHEHPHEDKITKNHHQLNQGQLSYGESYNNNHNKQFPKRGHQDHNAFPQQAQKDRSVESYPKAQDQPRYHHRDTSSSQYVSEPNVLHAKQSQGYESHVPFHGPTTKPQAKHEIHESSYHNTPPTKNHHFPEHQQTEFHNSQLVLEPSRHSGTHRDNSGYEPYSGPYTRPQVLHDGPNTQEFASVTVEPFGSAKAQPPQEFQPNNYLNSQYPAGPSRPDTHHVQTHSFSENQHGESQRQRQNQDVRNNGLSENRYSQFAPHTLFDDFPRNSHSHLQKPNTNQNSVTSRPQVYVGSVHEDNYGDHYPSEKNKNLGTHIESPHQYSYSRPATSMQNQQENFNAYLPHNTTRKEPISNVYPSYPYGGEYINHPDSKHNDYHTGNQLESSRPVPLRNFNTVPQDLYERHNSTKPNSFSPTSNPLTHPSYQNGGSFSDHYSSGSVEHTAPYQDLHVHQNPVPNPHIVHEGYNNTYFNTQQRPLDRGGHHIGNDHSYTLRQSEDSSIQQKYTPQDHGAASFTNHQTHQSSPSSSSSVVPFSSADHFIHAGNIQANAGQQDSTVPFTNHQLHQSSPSSSSSVVPFSSADHFIHAGNIQANAGQQDSTVPFTNHHFHQSSPSSSSSVVPFSSADHFIHAGNIQSNAEQDSTVPFTKHQLHQSSPSSSSSVVPFSSADHFNHAGNVQANAGQQESSVHTKGYPSVDNLYPGIQHEYALKFSFNKPKPISHTLPLIPNFNQSDHFAITPAPQIYAGQLDSGRQHTSGPVRYIDTQYGYAPHMPYHTVPVVKPIVLQSGYQEDTHEISHAKHDHLHVHHSSQSGYQYGIIN